MTDIKRIKRIMEDMDISTPKLAEMMYMSTPTMYSRLKGKSEFKADEMARLSEILMLNYSEVLEIFLGRGK